MFVGDMNIYWIGASLSFFAVFAILLTIPYAVFRQAWTNVMHHDGTYDWSRVWKELYALGDFVGGLILIPVAVFGIVSGAIAIIHHFVVPLPIVVDIFGAFDPDPKVWEAAIETGELGDVGAQYEEWSQSQGYSYTTARFWQEFLWNHWLILLIGSAGLAVFVYWFVTRFYVSAVVAYHKGIQDRRERYLRKEARPPFQYP